MRNDEFTSEICFKTPFGSLCIPLGTGPTIPIPSQSSSDTDPKDWSIVRSPQGEVSRAASRIGAADLLFSNRIQRTDEHTTKIFTFSRNGNEFLSAGGRAHHDSAKSKCCSGRLSMFAKGEGINYTMDVAAESCSTVRVSARTNGSVVERTLDLLSPGSFEKEPGLGVCHALDEAHLNDQLEPFHELLVVVGNYYWTQARREMASLADSLKSPTDGGTQASFWCGVMRASCWGLAAAGGGTCCIGTAAVGCALCAGGFGAAGSACSEAWSWC